MLTLTEKRSQKHTYQQTGDTDTDRRKRRHKYRYRYWQRWSSVDSDSPGRKAWPHSEMQCASSTTNMATLSDPGGGQRGSRMGRCECFGECLSISRGEGMYTKRKVAVLNKAMKIRLRNNWYIASIKSEIWQWSSSDNSVRSRSFAVSLTYNPPKFLIVKTLWRYI
jgi:hypothetical protein